MPAASKLQLYNPLHPERTLLYQTVAEHYETWLDLASAGQFDGQGALRTPKPYVRKAFGKYLECGIFAHGFARARCGDCAHDYFAHDYFAAFSCKGRGVCPSCNTRRMVEAAAHLTDHVFPRLPVRQWVLSVPKRLRYFMQRDGTVLNTVLRIFLRMIAGQGQVIAGQGQGSGLPTCKTRNQRYNIGSRLLPISLPLGYKNHSESWSQLTSPSSSDGYLNATLGCSSDGLTR